VKDDLVLPALTTLKSVDATAIRNITSYLASEIMNLRKEIETLKQQNVNREIARNQYMKGGR
jgi:hypothetical protein